MHLSNETEWKTKSLTIEGKVKNDDINVRAKR